MVKLISILISLTFISSFVQADTIDVWHVFYNNKMVGDFNAYGNNKISITRHEVRSGDSITVNYYRDTKCYNCATFLNVCVFNGKCIIQVNGIGTGNSLTFAANELLKLPDEKYFEVIYVDDLTKDQLEKRKIFVIVVE